MLINITNMRGLSCIDIPATKNLRIFYILVILLLLCASSFSIDVAAEEPILQEILKAPASALAQNYLEAQLIVRVKHEGKELSLKNPAAIAESAISVVDEMNSDYFFRGETKDQMIVIKPDLSVLDAWPQWAGPPSRSDLENCTITLEPLSSNSGSKQH